MTITTEDLIDRALAEDVGDGDVTVAATVDPDVRGVATVTQKAPGVVFGLDVAEAVFRRLDPGARFERMGPEGEWREPPAPVLRVEGAARALLTAERTALNFLRHLSGVATLTRRFVRATHGRATVLDTRKTTPGLRALEKAAVRAGGGVNHRGSLSDGVLIKDNHVAACEGDVELAIRRARDLAPKGVKIEIECDSPEQVERAVNAGADIILLDNMTLPQLKRCVAKAQGKAVTEASGGITLDTARQVADTGVDWISVGALTHSAPAMNLALDFD